jgi:hypothetical protein
VNLKQFLVDALSSALELSVGTPEDVLRHVTPDVLAEHLPRPLWARLLTACLGAPRVDAQLIVETIGIPNLCEHVPTSVLWAVIADIADQALGKAAQEDVVPLVATKSARAPLTPPPPPEAAPIARSRSSSSQPIPTGPAIPAPVNEPLADLLSELEADERPLSPPRQRPPTSQRFRQSGGTGISRPLGAGGVRRPQAQVPSPARGPIRRGATEVEAETSPSIDNGIEVDDSQLVDWQSDNAATSDDDFRKR